MPLFWVTCAVAVVVCFAQWIGVYFAINPIAILGEMSGSRCSVYIALLSFPIIYRALIWEPLRALGPSCDRYFTPILLIIVAAYFCLDSIEVGKQTQSQFIDDEIAVSKWMATTPPNTRFVTTQRALQQNSIALRPVTLPVPYLISMYRMRDQRAVDFDEKMVAFWGVPHDLDGAWLEGYFNNIESGLLQRLSEAQARQLMAAFDAKYLVAQRASATQLNWPVAYSNGSFVVLASPDAR
jgi:hypothetical protein